MDILDKPQIEYIQLEVHHHSESPRTSVNFKPQARNKPEPQQITPQETRGPFTAKSSSHSTSVIITYQ